MGHGYDTLSIFGSELIMNSLDEVGRRPDRELANFLSHKKLTAKFMFFAISPKSAGSRNDKSELFQ